jgi:tetratricopeptide (TPR) repeat protein
VLALRRGVYSLAHDVIPAEKRIRYALGYIELGILDAAREELDAIAPDEAGAPGIPGARIELAMAAGEWNGVVSLASRVVETDPAGERPWIAWAYALRELQLIRQALEVLLRGELHISAPTVLVDYNLACYLALLGDLKKARRRLDRVFAREPDWRAEAAEDPDLAALNLKG